MKPRAQSTRRKTRIQRENRERILEAALDVFSSYGFRGATVDQIAIAAGMSKPNLLYYFSGKEDMLQGLLDRLLDIWLAPLRKFDDRGEPLTEIRNYIKRKLDMARDYPRESRLFASEILQGAPHLKELLGAEIKQLIDSKVDVIQKWMDQGKLARCNPYHLLFSIWSTTQHYADFDAQLKVLLPAERYNDSRFEDAEQYLDLLFVQGLKPENSK
ncbi:MAG: TetR family transcriptional regulator C-terminal domain-containing protein [Rhizobiaceae bacterium]|nr:TetR family transcriptional regulator C-terminal domain-containing protein [Rhizobiaceae bacterium]